MVQQKHYGYKRNEKLVMYIPEYLFFFSLFCIQMHSLWVLFSYSYKETCFQHINMEDLKYR